MYRIEFKQQARKELARLPRKDQVRIAAAIDLLAQEPRPPACMPVRAAEGGTYRIRVGDYRVIYIVHDDRQLALIARVGRRRGDTYRRLS